MGSTGLFRPVNGHNSKNLQDMHTKLYINQHEIPRRLVYNKAVFEEENQKSKLKLKFQWMNIEEEILLTKLT